MKMIIILLSFSLLLLSCGQEGGGSSQAGDRSSTRDQNRDSNQTNTNTIEQLEQEVLSAAEDCSEEQKNLYEKRINAQKKTHTDRELKKSLMNMKKNIKC